MKTILTNKQRKTNVTRTHLKCPATSIDKQTHVEVVQNTNNPRHQTLPKPQTYVKAAQQTKQPKPNTYKAKQPKNVEKAQNPTQATKHKRKRKQQTQIANNSQDQSSNKRFSTRKRSNRIPNPHPKNQPHPTSKSPRNQSKYQWSIQTRNTKSQSKEKAIRNKQ